MAGLWTECCIAPFVLHAIDLGYQVSIVVDAGGDLTREAHVKALSRMYEAGAVPRTWLQVYMDLQGSVLGREAYFAMLRIAKEHATAYGLDLLYPLASPQSRRTRKEPAEYRYGP